jgi:riboflavin biosynthesis pyrimidine reductase
VVTVESAELDDRARAARVAEVIVAGQDDVDLAMVLRQLLERGHRNVLAEGGPGIAAQLAGAGLLDELCVTIAPVLVGGHATRILDGDLVRPAARLTLKHVLQSEDYLFLRYSK